MDSHQGGDFSTRQKEKGKHKLKRAESHRCVVNTLGIFAWNFSICFKVSQRDLV